jgi:tRNA (cmo5U34)-methyltransferase
MLTPKVLIILHEIENISMSVFDDRAREWDKNIMHSERSVAIALELEKMVPLNPAMKALEYGAGTGLLSFMLRDRFAEITLMDNSREMIEVCKEKVQYFKTDHIHPLWFDLEHNDFEGKFDVIFTQMVLHHVNDVDIILHKFYSILTPGGYLAIADLFTEDGSFHGLDVLDIHRGFDPKELGENLKTKGFKNFEYRSCFEIKRDIDKIFPVFLLVTKK